MSNDSRFVLSQLTRTGIWSSWCNLLQHKHMVLEADSVITFLYQQCLRKHLKRQRTLQPKASRGQANTTDYYAATLVNFRELAELFEQLLDFFAHNAIKLIVVYRGKHMEAPLFGLGPAQFKKNTQRASEPLIALIDYENSLHENGGGGGGKKSSHEHRSTLDRMRPTRPSLALNLFKQLVASRNHHRGGGQSAQHSNSSQATVTIGGGGGKQIECHQAFYCPYPLCARLARDFKCPVMTNDGDFVVMDVRAGFILFEEFFSSQLMASSNFVLRQQSAASISSVASTSTMARNQLTIGAQSVGAAGRRGAATLSPSMAPLASTRDLFQTARSRRTVGKSLKLRLHFHKQFLTQHPGLNPGLALQLFPLTSGEFLLKYAKSLVRLRIYEREYQEQDLIISSAQQTSFKKYHMAAARLERVMRYLCAKDQEVVPNLMRGEASRLAGSPIEQDYRELYNYYAVSYNFRGRLATILRSSADDLLPVAHIENVLVDRECSVDFWLGLCCAALGKLASVDYNKSIQFEDLATKHSAHAMLDRPKRLLMNVLSREAKTGKSLQAPQMSSSQRKELVQRFPAGSLTVIDRQARKLLERVIETTIVDDKQLEAQLKRLKQSLSINEIAKSNTLICSAVQSNDSASSMALPTAFKSSAVSLINLIFKSRDMTKLSALEPRNASGQNCDSIKWLASSAQIHQRLKTQLAILLTLHRFSVDQAINDDQYFRQNYLHLSQYFELGLIYSQLCSRLNSSELEQIINTNDRHNSVRNELKQAVDLINRLDLENVANYKGLAARVQSGAAAAAESSGVAVNLSKHMRHLIELLDDSIEAYCEVNAFLNYPLAQLQLQYYNPILLFNMIAFSLLAKASPPKPKPIAKVSGTFETGVSKQISKKAKK